MKSYKDFERVNIGSSDIASLTLRSCGNIGDLHFGEDGSYSAYEVIGEAYIGEHYTKIFSGEHWLKIFDDCGLAYNAEHPGMAVDVYHAGMRGCIIHWHEMEGEA